jgi:predicted amidohydrolase YtcJ
MKKRLFFIITIILPVIFTESCINNEFKNTADLVIKNAKIWTGNPAQNEAEALAVKDNKLIFVGTTEGVEKWVGDKTEVIDAKGMMLTPGFIDCHVHMHEGGTDLSSVKLRDANTKQLFIQRIADFAKTLPAGTWITGGTWDHTLWGGELPQATWIDSVTKQNPVLIMRLDGHMVLANSLAMKAANITAQTKDITGGVIMRDAKGNPQGVFKDNAQDILFNAMPPMPEEMRDKANINAMNYITSKGVTTVHNMGTWDDVASFRRLNKAGKMILRVYANVPLSTWARLADEVAKNGKGDDWVRIGGLKGFVDGSLGSHTAAMLEPFTDNKKDKGFFITPPDSLYYFVSNADKKGLNIMVHAIGDNAIRQQLTIFERVAKENGDRDRRFRIEHAQHIAPPEIARFAQLKVIPSMQPYHAIDDGRFAEKYLGYERCKTTYAFKSLLDAGATVAFGSDWFVAPPTPMDGIYAAVTRRTLDDKNPNGWIPEQKITVEQALKCYTINAAYASFEEKEKGSLEAGKLADFVLLEQDIRKIAPEKIKDVKIMMTVVGGKIVYKN